MFDAFKSLMSLLKYRRIHIDGSVFRLHYTLTVIILMAFCVIISTKQFAGEAIVCDAHDDTQKGLINAYCFVHTTFSVNSAFNQTVGTNIPYPGVSASEVSEDYVYHTYYQWVCFILFIEAILFYFPRWLWKMWEGDKMKALVTDISIGTETQKRGNAIKSTVNYLKTSKGRNDWYALRYFFCEILSLINVLAQMWMLDVLLGGKFFSFGIDIIRYSQLDPETRVDPMIRIFPRLSKCHFHKYGGSGVLQTVDALCLLPINVINEKIFIFLWFWFFILAILTVITIVVRIMLILYPIVRCYVFHWRFRVISDEKLDLHFMQSLNLGDWFLLYMLGQNLDPMLIREVLEMMADQHTTATCFSKIESNNV